MEGLSARRIQDLGEVMAVMVLIIVKMIIVIINSGDKL